MREHKIIKEVITMNNRVNSNNTVNVNLTVNINPNSKKDSKMFS